MSSGKLLFYPPPGQAPPAIPAIEDRLQKIGFIGDPMEEAEQHYYTGARFLQLITFMGCSPNLKFQPSAENDWDFCYIRILGPFREYLILHGSNTRPPKCADCGQPQSQWRQASTDWLGYPRSHRCSGCGASLEPDQLDWGRTGACSRLFIEVSSVFPGEAVPGKELLDSLGSWGGEWRYCYLLHPAEPDQEK